MSVEYVMERWTGAGHPSEMPAEVFKELSSATATRTRKVLGIQAVKRGKKWVWVFPDVLRPTRVPEPTQTATDVPESAPERTNPTQLWQDGQSMRMEYPLPPSPYAPPQGNISPTASGGPDTFDWVTKGKGEYVVDPAGGKHPTTFVQERR